MRQFLIGLAATAVAGLLVLVVEYSFFNQRSSQPQPNTAPGLEESSAQPQPSAAPERSVALAPQAGDDTQTLRQTAKRITSSSARDQELTNVTRLAVDRKQYRLAVEIARDIFSPTARDKALEVVACYALTVADDRSAAEAAARAVTSPTKRDEVYRTILARAARKDESNDVPCSKL